MKRGPVSGRVSATTGSMGAATIPSATTKKAATISDTVRGITPSGYGYDATAHPVSTRSVSS